MGMPGPRIIRCASTIQMRVQRQQIDTSCDLEGMGKDDYEVVRGQKCGWGDRSAILSVGRRRHGRGKNTREK